MIPDSRISSLYLSDSAFVGFFFFLSISARIRCYPRVIVTALSLFGFIGLNGNIEISVEPSAGEENGVIVVSVTGTASPFRFQLLESCGPMSVINQNTIPISRKYKFENLAVGVYYVNVIDRFGCETCEGMGGSIVDSANGTAGPFEIFLLSPYDDSLVKCHSVNSFRLNHAI